jgi:hypothetical protein
MSTLLHFSKCSTNCQISKLTSLQNQMVSRIGSARFCLCHLSTDLSNTQCICQQRYNQAFEKKANVIPIPKSQPPKSAKDYLRPISLTSTFSKILESLVGNWILAKVTNKLDVRQFVALRGRSTTHN